MDLQMIRHRRITPLKEENANFMLKQFVRAEKNNTNILSTYIEGGFEREGDALTFYPILGNYFHKLTQNVSAFKLSLL